MKAKLKNCLPHWGTLLSALLFALTYPEISISWLSWFILTPWLYSLYLAPNTKKAFQQGLWLSILTTLSSFYWVAYATHNYGNLPWAFSFLLLILFSLFNEIQFLVFPILFKWVQKKEAHLSSALGLLFLSFSYVVLDLYLPKLFQNSLGHAFYLMQDMRQIYDLSGVSILTFILTLHSISLFFLILKRKKLLYIISLSFILSLWIYGNLQNKKIKELLSAPTKTLQVAAIQGNIGDQYKVAAIKGVSNTREYILNTFYRLTDQALELTPKPSVVIWPETTYPTSFRSPWTYYDLTLEKQLEEFVRKRNFNLLFGGYDHKNKKDHNALFALTPSPRILDEPNSDLQTYQKSVLLPFGEYVPFFDDKSFFKKLFPNMGFFGKGVGASVLDFKVNNTDYYFGPVICFEVLFPEYVRQSTLKGSEMIVNITNDSWFGRYGEPIQHLALSTFRSIENRIPQIRSTNTGVTALILQDGSIVQQTQIGTEEILNVTIPFISKQETLFLKWGDWFKILSLISSIILGGLLWNGISRRSSLT